jgi:ABC-2 type transport system permease protein
MVEDIRSGYLTKIMATTANRSAILMGRILSDVFRVLVQSSIILILAFAIGVSPATGALGYLIILLIVAYFSLAWSGISLALGLKTKNSETVFGIAGFLTFPLLFMSTALVRQNFMPDWMQAVSNVNPISFAVNGIRNFILPPTIAGSTAWDWNVIWGDALLAFAVITLIAVLTLGATLYQFKKIIS